jgi:hypothetical protein
MGFLSGKTTYLAGPIHHIDDCNSWRDCLTPKLEEMGIIVQNPCKKTIDNTSCINEDKDKLKELILKEDFLEVKKVFFPILKADLRCVDVSHFIIFMYSPRTRQFGSTHELITANLQKKPILMFYPKEELSDFNPWAACLVKAQHIYSSWDKKIDYLKEVNKGNFDSSLWY